MKKMIALVMTLCLFCSLTTVHAESASLLTPREVIGLEAEASPEWAAALAEKQEAQQLFVVAVYKNTTAWISLHEKDETGAWKMIMSTPGFIGINGLGKTSLGFNFIKL